MGRSRAGFSLVVSLDASEIEGFEPGREVKVAVQDEGGQTRSETVSFDKGGKASTRFGFTERPGPLRVIVGPADATDEELAGMQTLGVDVAVGQWEAGREVRLTPIKIPPYYWHWWPVWCRTYTITGRVLCPDGSPVPGATVCAYDTDWWWWWSSTQQVGCDTTDITGSFQISFRWCCGWWPWWWWRWRVWQLEPYLLDRLMPVLHELKLPKIPRPGPRPDLSAFEGLLADPGMRPPRPPIGGPLDRGLPPEFRGLSSKVVGAFSRSQLPDDQADTLSAGSVSEIISEISRSTVGSRQLIVPLAKGGVPVSELEALRERLVARIPKLPELEQLRIWPWWPWWPWWDCEPDILFRATQNCQGDQTVIVNENIFQTRWNVSSPLSVTLVADQGACCLPPGHPCTEGDCLELTQACDDSVANIGGNTTPPVPPAGFVNPGLVSIYGDRPYAGTVPISGTADCMSGVDYYEFEWSDDGGATWNDMPAGSAGPFTRWYVDFNPPSPAFLPVTFSATPPTAGRNVYETLQHYQAGNPPADWGLTRVWDGGRDVLMNWLTDAMTWADGTYHLRVKGWNLVGGNLVNPRILKVCGAGQVDNGIVLTLDNRLEGAASGHPPSTPDHPCGPGTVHTCTLEPDTDFLSVKIVHADSTESDVGPCSIANITDTDDLQIDFFVHDPDGHLAFYTLQATWGENLAVDLLGLGGMTLAPFTGPPAPPVPAATEVGPSYDLALAGLGPNNGTATPPTWAGGSIRLRVQAKKVFKETCCYQLELRGHKRTIVSCDDSLWGHTNYSEYSFMIVV